MYKYLIFVLLLSSTLNAQLKTDVLHFDSLSYRFYLSGDWKQLIEIGNVAEENRVNFMYLQQRLGYANFMLGNNYRAIKHYTDALKFDPTDQISHSYLYYTALRVGDQNMAMYHASKLSTETQKMLHVKSFKVLEAIDFEYNYKMNDSDVRSNPNYVRIGLNTQLNHRLMFYQTVSFYNQLIDTDTKVRQSEYFSMLSYNLLSRTTLRLGYHYLNAKVESTIYNYYDTLQNNVFIGSVTQRIGRFDLGVSSSFLTGDTLQVQVGANLGYHIPGAIKPYLKTSVYSISRNGINRLVYAQSFGLLASPKLWLEGDVVFGNLFNYVENDGLYVYNSLDATTFRLGATAFWYVMPKLTLFANYSFNKKMISNTSNYYNQNSLSGGFIWKL